MVSVFDHHDGAAALGQQRADRGPRGAAADAENRAFQRRLHTMGTHHVHCRKL